MTWLKLNSRMPPQLFTWWTQQEQFDKVAQVPWCGAVKGVAASCSQHINNMSPILWVMLLIHTNKCKFWASRSGGNILKEDITCRTHLEMRVVHGILYSDLGNPISRVTVGEVSHSVTYIATHLNMLWSTLHLTVQKSSPYSCCLVWLIPVETLTIPTLPISTFVVASSLLQSSTALRVLGNVDQCNK